MQNVRQSVAWCQKVFFILQQKWIASMPRTVCGINACEIHFVAAAGSYFLQVAFARDTEYCRNLLLRWFRPLCLDPSDGVFGRFDLAALCGCHTLNVCCCCQALFP